jgi:hypothetical protein
VLLSLSKASSSKHTEAVKPRASCRSGLLLVFVSGLGGVAWCGVEQVAGPATPSGLSHAFGASWGLEVCSGQRDGDGMISPRGSFLVS